MIKIAIDFDGVVNTVKESEPGEFGEAVFGVKDAIKSFLDDGFEVIIYTARSDLNNVKKWLKQNDFPNLEVTNKKIPSCSLYIDDRGFRFNEWSENEIKIMKEQALQTQEQLIAEKPVVGYKREFFEKEAKTSFK